MRVGVLMGETYISGANPCGAWFRFVRMSTQWVCQLSSGHLGYHMGQDGYQWSDETYRLLLPDGIVEGFSPSMPKTEE
jgi:hypothetical protein